MTVTASKLRLGAASSMLLGGTDMGASTGGLMLNYTPKYSPIECDQVLGPVAAYKIQEEVTLEVGMYQYQMSLISMAFGVYGLGDVTTVSGSPNKDTLTFGGRFGSNVSTFDATIPKNDGTTNSLQVHLNKVYSAKAIKMNFQRDKPTEYKTEFDALADPSQPAGQQFGYLWELY